MTELYDDVLAVIIDQTEAKPLWCQRATDGVMELFDVERARLLERVAFICQRYRDMGVGVAYLTEMLTREGFFGPDERDRYIKAFGKDYSL